MTGLTGEEKRLLSALVHFPDETDRRLGEMAGLDPLKATYIRTRMQKLGIFRYLRVPAFSRLGAEVFWAGVLETGTGGEGRAASERLKRVLGGMPGIFWAVAEGGKAIVLGIYRSSADAAADVARMETVPGVKVNGSLVLPMTALENGAFLDFSNVLARPQGVLGPEKAAPGNAGRFRPLLGFEKQALQTLVDFPDDGHTAAARRMGTTPKIFLERIREIRSEGLCRTVAVPDIRLLGLGTLAAWMAGADDAKHRAYPAVQEPPATSVEVRAQDEGPPRDGPIRDADLGDPLPSDTPMMPEQDAVLPEGLPAGLKDDEVAITGAARGKGRARDGAQKGMPAGAGSRHGANEDRAALDRWDGPGNAPVPVGSKDGTGKARSGNGDGAGKVTPGNDAVKMPWQVAPMLRPGRPRFDGPRPWESGPPGGKRGIEALPKDIARTLIGRPSRETVEQARSELERRRIWDIDLDRILQDAGVVPAKRAAPAAAPLPPEWVKLGGEGRPAQPVGSARGSATVRGERRDIPISGAAVAPGTNPPPGRLAITLPVKRKRGRPPKIKGVPVGNGVAAPHGAALAVPAGGNTVAPAPVGKRKRGRPRKTPVNGNLAMAMERFSVRVDEDGGQAGRERAAAGPGSEALPVFLEARESGRRFVLGLFREKGDADRADEQVRREAGSDLGRHLLPAARLEMLKPLDLGAVTRRILELDQA